MPRRPSILAPRPRRTSGLARRRGTTLLEGLIASVLLATSVVGIGGALAASYQNQVAAQARRDAILAGRKVMDSITALPMDPAVAGQASLADYVPANSTTTTTTTNTGLLGGLLPYISVNVLNVGVTLGTSTTTNATAASAAPTISVERRASLDGAVSSTGDFALVTVLTPVDAKQAPRKLRRLVTRTEAAANQAP